MAPRPPSLGRAPAEPWRASALPQDVSRHEVHSRVVHAGQRAIAGPAVEERLWPARAPQTLAKRRGGRGLDARLAGGVRRQHDAVVFTRRARADLALEHVERHQLRLALERIAPAAAARRFYPNERAGGGPPPRAPTPETTPASARPGARPPHKRPRPLPPP